MMDSSKKNFPLFSIIQDDLKEAFPTLGANLEKLRAFEGNVEEAFSLDFVVTYDYFGEMRKHELKPDGTNISVTNDNRKGKPSFL